MIGHHHTLTRRRERKDGGIKIIKKRPPETNHHSAPHIGCTTRKRTSMCFQHSHKMWCLAAASEEHVRRSLIRACMARTNYFIYISVCVCV